MRLFNWGATMSHGALAGDIPGLAIGATRLAQAIARDLFVEDADRHWARLQAHDEPELAATRWYVPPDRRETR
jgi:cation diffusion facilitator CzcD-associated flavoprotein CzcO